MPKERAGSSNSLRKNVRKRGRKATPSGRHKPEGCVERMRTTRKQVLLSSEDVRRRRSRRRDFHRDHGYLGRIHRRRRRGFREELEDVLRLQ